MAETKLIVNLTRDECVCVGELADRSLPRMRGLMGRRGLPAGEGLLISPAPAIHTAFMRFPIDALFLDRNLRVLEIVERLRPWRVASKRGARAVLELSAGECARRGVEVGDRLELRDHDAAPAIRSGANELADGWPETAALPETADLETSEPGDGAVRQWLGGGVARLQPLRVLVISHDRRFRNVTSLLLARRNCSVSTTANASRVTELIARESPDVVVVDASQLPAAATVAKVQALARPVGVVLVADEGSSGCSDRPVVAKWGPFEELVAAIEQADERRGSLGDTHARS